MADELKYILDEVPVSAWQLLLRAASLDPAFSSLLDDLRARATWILRNHDHDVARNPAFSEEVTRSVS